jgi:hypothetical protein
LILEATGDIGVGLFKWGIDIIINFNNRFDDYIKLA